jgi:hypothetical protein
MALTLTIEWAEKSSLYDNTYVREAHQTNDKNTQNKFQKCTTNKQTNK